VLEVVGRGSFGTVYKARDDQLQRDVAIKVPHRDRLVSPAIEKMLLREARSLALLRHPAIVPIYDVAYAELTGQDEGDQGASLWSEFGRRQTKETATEHPTGMYIVSDFMDGGNLADFVRHHRLSMNDLTRIVIRIADALHYAHGKGLVHRDVKLSNLLCDADGEVYVADFGLALRDAEVGTGAGFAGTPSNMSPEQARGDAHLVDGRTDIYGLGCVLYELMTGKKPIECQETKSLLLQIEKREPKPPRQINDQIPVELERICGQVFNGTRHGRRLTTRAGRRTPSPGQ
jgi:serine/threonine protein kinase